MMKPLSYPLLALVALLLVACTGNGGHPTVPLAERARIDSLVGRCADDYQLMRLQETFEREGNTLGSVVVCRELNKHYRNESRFERSIDVQQQGLRLATELADTLEMVRALNNIGTSYRRLGMLDLATEYHYRVLECCMGFSDKESYGAQKNRVTSLNGLGNVYLTLGDMQQADSVLRQALAGEQQLGSALGQAINYANLGAIFEEREQYDSAWIYFKRSAAQNKLAHSELGEALCHNHFGRIHEKRGQLDLATAEYLQAFDMMQEQGDEWHALEASISLARIYWKMGQREQSMSMLGHARQTARRIKSLEHLGEIYQLYYTIYSEQGNTLMALQSYLKADAYEDSVLSLKKVSDIQNLRLKMERSHKQQEVNTAMSKVQSEKRQKYHMLALAAGLLLALAAGLLLALAATVAAFSYALRLRKRNEQATRQAQAAREHFFTNITHELRTPLTVILGQGTALQAARQPDAKQVHTAADQIVRQGKSLLQLINQLLDISKVRSAIGEPDWRSGNIVAFLTMVVEGYQDYALQRHLELSYTPAEAEVQMDFVPDYMRKIASNLLSNAIKFTPEYGSIGMSTRQQGQRLVLTVTDTGRGINSRDLPHIFEAFYQAEDGKLSLGTGIGLSLVAQMVAAMGGTIGADSHPDKGTVFTVTLPLRHGAGGWKTADTQYDSEWQQVQLADIGLHANHTRSDDMADSTMNTRVLIVEDNDDVAAYIGQQLQRKYSIAYASNGTEGIKKAEEVMPDIIITDLMMPGIDGYELCRRVRLSPLLNHIPVIMITARSTEEDRVRGLQAGADAYLYKPFNSDELNVRVEMLLEQRRMLRNKYSQALMEGREAEVELTLTGRDFVQQVTAAIHKQMGLGAVDIATVADALCMSPSQFRRKLYTTTGETPANYILYVRMNHAKRLLDSRTDLNIGDVAVKCGFEDSSHFTRAFKQAYQMTPSQYRRRKAVQARGK